MGIKVCDTFSDAEAAEGSNVRELLATRNSLQTLLPFLTSLSMDHRVDNSGVAIALGGLIPASQDNIYGGSRNRDPRIQALVIEIDDFCVQANINRRTFWIPRSLNQIADYLNKVRTGDQYSHMLRPEVFAHLQITIGLHTIDRFASRNNVQVYPPRYFSKFFEPEAEGIDAFSCHWKYNELGELENNWLYPPYLAEVLLTKIPAMVSSSASLSCLMRRAGARPRRS